jgi:hypothetical protein
VFNSELCAIAQVFILVKSNIEGIMFASDAGSERATSIEDYQSTCINFILDISRDYKDWVDRYQLSDRESNLRKHTIDSIVNNTNTWIAKYGNTIKKVDIIMNDGVSKMAENTAGYPFSLSISLDGQMRYVSHPIGSILLRVRALPRDDKGVRLGAYSKENFFQLSSSAELSYYVSKESFKKSDILDDVITLDATKCSSGDLISITVIAEELSDEYVSESRGFTTLILLQDINSTND